MAPHCMGPAACRRDSQGIQEDGPGVINGDWPFTTPTGVISGGGVDVPDFGPSPSTGSDRSTSSSSAEQTGGGDNSNGGNSSSDNRDDSATSPPTEIPTVTNKRPLPEGTVSGITVTAVLLLFTLVMLAAWWYVRRKRDEEKKDDDDGNDDDNHSNSNEDGGYGGGGSGGDDIRMGENNQTAGLCDGGDPGGPGTVEQGGQRLSHNSTGSSESYSGTATTSSGNSNHLSPQTPVDDTFAMVTASAQDTDAGASANQEGTAAVALAPLVVHGDAPPAYEDVTVSSSPRSASGAQAYVADGFRRYSPVIEGDVKHGGAGVNNGSTDKADMADMAGRPQ